MTVRYCLYWIKCLYILIKHSILDWLTKHRAEAPPTSTTAYRLHVHDTCYEGYVSLRCVWSLHEPESLCLGYLHLVLYLITRARANHNFKSYGTTSSRYNLMLPALVQRFGFYRCIIKEEIEIPVGRMLTLMSRWTSCSMRAQLLEKYRRCLHFFDLDCHIRHCSILLQDEDNRAISLRSIHYARYTFHRLVTASNVQ